MVRQSCDQNPDEVEIIDVGMYTTLVSYITIEKCEAEGREESEA